MSNETTEPVHTISPALAYVLARLETTRDDAAPVAEFESSLPLIPLKETVRT